MTSNWKECNLETVIELVIDYRGKTPKKLGGNWSNSGYRALSAKNIKTGSIVQPESIRFVDDNLYKKWMKDEIKRGDILITSEAPFGQIYYWNSDEKIVLSQRIFGLRINNNFISKYVYYYMITKNFQAELDARATGTTVVGLRQPELLKCKIQFPDKKNQQKIARVLSAIDDKIELNNSINKNLEQQMQSIFLELFPFIFNNANDTFEKIISFSNGKKRPENMGKIPVYGGNGILAYSDSSNSENCVIIGRVGAYCGNTFLCIGPCWVSDNAIQAKSKIGYSQLFIFYILKNAHLQSRHIGTGQPLMTQGILNSIPFNMPDISIIKQFTDNCEPMQKLIIDNTIENERLTQLRDTLLPKLMNGEIDVDKVEV